MIFSRLLIKYFAIADANIFFPQIPYSSVLAISDYFEFQILKWIKLSSKAVFTSSKSF